VPARSKRYREYELKPKIFSENPLHFKNKVINLENNAQAGEGCFNQQLLLLNQKLLTYGTFHVTFLNGWEFIPFPGRRGKGTKFWLYDI